MALNDLARVVISTEGPALTQVGFGTLLCAAYFTGIFGANERVRSYTSLAGAVADGFVASSPVHRMLTRAFQQDPRPAVVKVGKRLLPQTQTVKFSVATLQNSTLYGFTMTRLGVSVDVVFTSDASALATEIAAGLVAAAEASALGANVVATTADAGATAQIVSTAGEVIYYSNWTPNLSFADLTTDPGIATDLAAIRSADSDWYGLALDHDCLATSKAAAAYIETLTAMYFPSVSDSDAMNSGVSTDLGAFLKGTSIGRTPVSFDLNDTAGYAGVAAFAERAPFDPGQPGAGGTFHGKTLVGVTVDPLSDTQKANLRLKNYMVYISTAGRGHTLDGKVAGGEFADVVRGLDWFKLRSEEALATVILNAQKVPYNDRGISMLKTTLDAIGGQAETNELFTNGTYSSTAPKASAVLAADRKARKLTGLAATAQLAGAIHLVDPITITVTG
jgi:hypothetical protein